jgi:pilus assembly protein CpaC
MYADKFRAGGLALLILLGLGQRSAVAQGPNPPPSRTTAPSTSSIDLQSIDLQVGEQRVIPSDNVRSYSEGAKGIVDVRLTKDATEFIVVALKPGATTLLFLMMDGSERHFKITVNDTDGPRTVSKDSNTVQPKDNIRLDFYFVQLNKSYRHQIGLGWPHTIAPTMSAQYDLKGGNLDSATAVITNQALPRLDMAQVSGWAKVMRQAAVVTANGEKASFSGGGEVNFPIQSALTSSLHKIPFGSVIDVEPKYDASTGRIQLRLHADISELDGDNGTSVPGRMTSTLDTQVNLELGQSLVLAGLTARSERRSKGGVPVLSQIPIFGVFFGSHSRAEEESENIVLIVPSVVDAVSMQDRNRIESALATYTDYSGNIADVNFIPPAVTKPLSTLNTKPTTPRQP